MEERRWDLLGEIKDLDCKIVNLKEQILDLKSTNSQLMSQVAITEEELLLKCQENTELMDKLAKIDFVEHKNGQLIKELNFVSDYLISESEKNHSLRRLADQLRDKAEYAEEENHLIKKAMGEPWSTPDIMESADAKDILRREGIVNKIF